MPDTSDPIDPDDAPAQPLALPLDRWHRSRGARMVPFAGYWMPVQYDGILAEHNWTRAQAGLFDVSHMGQLLVTGAGACAALEALLPADIAALKPGRVRYSLLLDDDGGILDDLMVTNITAPLLDDDGAVAGPGEPTYHIVVNGATKWDDIAWLREHLPDEVGLHHMEDQALLAIQGPNAAAALERVFRGLTDAMGFMQSELRPWGETQLRFTRAGYTGEDGFEISVPAPFAEMLAGRLLAEIEIRPAGLGARDTLRLEAGLPLYGHDMTAATDPVGADLGFAISKRRRAEGGFKGAERVLKGLQDGAATRRVGLTLDGRQAAREGAVVMAGDLQVGVVTSGGFSPTLGHPIAMAQVAAEHGAVDTQLSIEVRNKRVPARVTRLPFVPHRYHRKEANR